MCTNCTHYWKKWLNSIKMDYRWMWSKFRLSWMLKYIVTFWHSSAKTTSTCEELEFIYDIWLLWSRVQFWTDFSLYSRLVTTDTLARGIDLQNVDYVILYDSPRFVKNYIHRIGRTGRAGNKGTSLVLITPDQVRASISDSNFVKRIETCLY